MPHSCSKCHGRKYMLDRKGDLAHAVLCGCARPCQKCGDLGYVYAKKEATFSERAGARSYELLVDCLCKIRERRVRQFNEAHLPACSAAVTFESFKPAKTEQARALKAMQAFAHGYSQSERPRGIVLSGPVGTGKTHLIAAALSYLLLEKGVRCAYVEISLLYATIRRGFQEGKSGGEIIGPLSEVDVLAIDELGKGRGSQFELETMDELIARRYNARRTTLFATNYSLAPEHKKSSARTASGHIDTDPKKAGGESQLLRERVGERIYSRLCEMCDFLAMPLDTPDHRRARHEVR
ncbi:MAG TPA: ATP-binding protein [Myxococcaceae bacterium]|nr:ATP-binding protein [Myxococcaceae bacterium]